MRRRQHVASSPERLGPELDRRQHDGDARDPAAGTAHSVLDTVGSDTLPVPTRNSWLIPAGQDTKDFEDRPLANALTDAKAPIVAAMNRAAGVAACRNSVVVLIAGGKDYFTDAPSPPRRLSS